MIKEHVEYVKINSFPDEKVQVWKMTYYVGTVLEDNKKIPIGTAVLDGKARPKSKKVKNFDGFVTDWLALKQCKIVGHGIEYFNFVSPPKKVRKPKKLETTNFPLLAELKKQEEEIARKLLEENYDLKKKQEEDAK